VGPAGSGLRPFCGYCSQIAGDLAALEADLAERGVALALLTIGDADSNRALAEEHGLTAPVLLQGDGVDAFRSLGTPAADLVDEDGQVAAPVAIGALQVPALARRSAGLPEGDDDHAGHDHAGHDHA
jgi:AhpC/TSA family